MAVVVDLAGAFQVLPSVVPLVVLPLLAVVAAYWVPPVERRLAVSQEAVAVLLAVLSWGPLVAFGQDPAAAPLGVRSAVDFLAVGKEPVALALLELV